MAEILLKLKDMELSRDAAIDSQRDRRGDVIVALPDGHDWATAELEWPDWIIVKIPGMSVDEASAVAAPEPPDPNNPGAIRWKRLFSINLDAVAQVAPSAVPLFAWPRCQPFITVDDPNLARALKYERPPGGA